MKVLYYGLRFSDRELTGSEVIRKRNLTLLRHVFGEDSIVCYTHIRPRIIRPFRYLMAFFRHLAGDSLFTDRDLLRTMRESGAGRIFIDGTIGAKFGRRFLRQYRAITFLHNVEYDYFLAQIRSFRESGKAEKERTEYLRMLLSVPLVYLRERALCRYSELVIALNERDSARIRELYGRPADFLMPTSMKDRAGGTAAAPGSGPEAVSGKDAAARPYLLFVGSDFYGNTDGLFLFCERCMPEIRAALLVVGTGMEKYRGRYDPEKIVFMGYVPDLEALYRNAAAVVLPVISGSGMKTKTCEALMYGKVIFGTRESFEGYAVSESEDCVVCGSFEELAARISAYLDSGPRYYSAANRNLYLRRYEAGVIEEQFARFLKERESGSGRKLLREEQ